MSKNRRFGILCLKKDHAELQTQKRIATKEEKMKKYYLYILP